jgi:hypothetical protein
MTILRTIVSVMIASTVMIVATTAHASGDGTPDGQPPAEEQVCESAGLFGSAFGLCVAFCEANDCDAQLGEPDDRACSMLRAKYVRASGEFFFPCETGNEDDI